MASAADISNYINSLPANYRDHARSLVQRMLAKGKSNAQTLQIVKMQVGLAMSRSGHKKPASAAKPAPKDKLPQGLSSYIARIPPAYRKDAREVAEVYYLDKGQSAESVLARVKERLPMTVRAGIAARGALAAHTEATAPRRKNPPRVTQTAAVIKRRIAPLTKGFSSYEKKQVFDVYEAALAGSGQTDYALSAAASRATAIARKKPAASAPAAKKTAKKTAKKAAKKTAKKAAKKTAAPSARIADTISRKDAMAAARKATKNLIKGFSAAQKNEVVRYYADKYQETHSKREALHWTRQGIQRIKEGITGPAKKAASKKTASKSEPVQKIDVQKDIVQGAKTKRAAVKVAQNTAGLPKAPVVRGAINQGKIVDVKKVIRGAKTRNMRLWVCEGENRTGCGGGKSGGHVRGFLL